MAVTLRHVPESRGGTAAERFDVTGAALGALGLAGVTVALVRAGEGGAPALVAASAVTGLVAMGVFVIVERRSRFPMLPLGLFASGQFTAANLVTFAVYAALGGVFFFLVVHLQVVSGFGPILAGAALLPVTLLMLALSAPAGTLAQRLGPRGPMTVGPLLCAGGLLLLRRIGVHASYAGDVLPGVTLLGLGLSLTVAPLTATVLAAADVRHAGVASSVNNAVARAAGLLAVAALPLLAGLSGADYRDPAAFAAGFRTAMLLCSVLLTLGGALAWVTIRADVLAGEPERAPPPQPRCRTHCAVGAPPLERPG